MIKLSNTFFPEEIVHRKKPLNIVERDTELFSHEYEKKFSKIYLKQYFNFKLFPNGLSLTGLKIPSYLSKGLPWIIKLKVYLIVLKEYFKKINVKKIDKAIVITDGSSDGYFHWFGDVLQKLEAMESLKKDIVDYKIVIPYNCSKNFVLESLKLYDFGFYILKENEYLKSQEVIYIPNVAPTGNFRVDLIKSMRNRFITQYKLSSGDERIYISRGKAIRRRITNENDLIRVLKKYNYKIVYMEDLSFQEQCKAIYSSSSIISLHGAGLTNMLWLKENSNILEIRAVDDNENNCYFSLASGLDLNYYYSLAKKEDKDSSTRDSNFIADIHDIEKQICLMIDKGGLR